VAAEAEGTISLTADGGVPLDLTATYTREALLGPAGASYEHIGTVVAMDGRHSGGNGTAAKPWSKGASLRSAMCALADTPVVKPTESGQTKKSGPQVSGQASKSGEPHVTGQTKCNWSNLGAGGCGREGLQDDGVRMDQAGEPGTQEMVKRKWSKGNGQRGNTLMDQAAARQEMAGKTQEMAGKCRKWPKQRIKEGTCITQVGCTGHRGGLNMALFRRVLEHYG
jgi:hypothetical protein